mmetsp:Transcript_15175/g.42786  ORF Transcript_15175/g.42786 Transcript_15175/m.42786 type:complete len:86 (-) Transcript_15175:404-661(-)
MCKLTHIRIRANIHTHSNMPNRNGKEPARNVRLLIMFATNIHIHNNQSCTPISSILINKDFLQRCRNRGITNLVTKDILSTRNVE